MKKSLSILIGLLLVFMLAACNMKADSVNNQDGSKSNKNSGMTLTQVFEKTDEASKRLKSFKVKMDMKQNVTSDEDNGGNAKFDSTIEMDVVQNPMAFHQKMSMQMPESDESMEMESYFSKDGMYFHDPSTKTWMKFPSEMMGQIANINEQQTNPVAEIEKLRKFVDDFKFQQDDQSYILLLNASGKKFTDFLKETIQKSVPAGTADSAEALKHMKINKMNYEIHIDKKTFFPTVLNVNMEMEMTVEGKTVKMAQDINGQYLEHNQITQIVVPKEVMEGAVEAGQ